MKTTLFTLILTIFISWNGKAQGVLTTEYQDNHLLVYFTPNTPNSVIDDLILQLQATELWISPLSNARYWHIPTNGQIITIDGQDFVIDEITDALEGILKVSGSSGDLDDDSEGVGLSYTATTQPISMQPSLPRPLSCEQNMDLYAAPGESPIRVAINDSGYTPDLVATPQIPYTPTVTNRVDYINSNNNSVDQYGHGTHVLGVASYVAHHDAPNSNVPFTYDVHRILDESGAGTLANLIYSVENAIVNGAQIINLSLGIISNNGTNSFLNRMIEQVEANNALLVIAAGNNNLNLVINNFILPASIQSPNIITVASTSCKKGLSNFSNYGSLNVDIVAPGEQVIGYDHNSNLIVMTGTSQATAIVSGVAAIVGSHQRKFDAPLVKCAILEGSTYSANLDGYIVSAGTINADGAVNALNSSVCNPQLKPINLVSDSPKSNVYPNPFTESIVFESESPMKTILITDIFGKQVLNKSIHHYEENSIKLNTTDFPSGIYIATIKKSDNTEESYKLIKS